MNILTILAIVSVCLTFTFIFAGYIVSYLIVTPILMSKHGKRSLKESYIWIASCFSAEDDLKNIHIETGDAIAGFTIKIIKISKILIPTTFLLFIILCLFQ